MSSPFVVAMFGIAVALSCASRPVHAAPYSLTILPPIAEDKINGGWSYAVGINDSGQVLVTSANGIAFLWDGTEYVSTGLLRNEVGGLSNGGAVAGRQRGVSEDPAIWANGQLTTLPLMVGTPFAIANSVNDLGQATGISGSSFFHALYWDQFGVQDINPANAWYSVANSINTTGQVVGCFAPTPQSVCRAFSWNKGSFVDLAAASNATAEGNSTALDVTEAGLVVGQASINGFDRAVAWINGELIVLPDGPVPNQRSFAMAANGTGQIVGGRSAGIVEAGALLWQNNQMWDLNGLVDAPPDFRLAHAYDINSVGEIVGFGIRLDGMRLGFILRPTGEAFPSANVPERNDIPEPSGWALLAATTAIALIRSRH